MIPILNLPYGGGSIVRGDTWNGLSLTATTGGETPVPLDLTDCSIRLHLYHSTGTKIELETDGNGITITDAIAGKFQINSIERLNWKVGKHSGDVEITYSSNVRKTLFQININVVDDITK